MNLVAIAAFALVSVGLHGLLAVRDPLRRLLAANVLGSGVFVLLLGSARDASGRLDPVPQAMVLTGIVVSFAATALALVLIRTLGSPTDDTSDVAPRSDLDQTSHEMDD